MRTDEQAAPPRRGSGQSRERIFLIGLAGVLIIATLSWRPGPSTLRQNRAFATPARFVGTASCRACHELEFDLWAGSDHDRAMDIATETTVLGDFADAEISHHGLTSRFYRRDGDFFVWTEGPDGRMGEFEITHTFGHDPLQQYLVPFEGGRLQALPLAWDGQRNRWFHLYADTTYAPDDWLHWTRGGQNWNGMCAECHSTNLQKNYDPGTRTYATTWSDIDVGCEACHGPGSTHIVWARISPGGRPDLANAGLDVATDGIPGRRLVAQCAPCHARRMELGDYDHSDRDLLDHVVPSLLHEGVYHADGQIQDEVYVYGSFVQSRMHNQGISCRDCHDSHSLKLRREGNALCLGCHQGEKYDTPKHHFHRLAVDGEPSPGASCIKCHMMEQPYMVIDWRADHSFRVPRPDLGAVTGAPNSCSSLGCHDDRPLSWAVEAYDRWYGPDHKPHFGTAFAAARRGEASARTALESMVADTLTAAIVQATAVELLARLPGGLPEALLVAALAADDPLVRQSAAAAFVATDTRLLVDRLAPLLGDPVKAVRLAVVPRLAEVPREALAPQQQDAFDLAADEYRAAMAHTLDTAAAGFNLGNLAASLGDMAEAERHYRHALDIDDRIPMVHANLALLLNGQGRNDEAEHHLRQAVALAPDPGAPAYNLGLLLAEVGKHEEAAGFLELAAGALPERARVHYNLGLVRQTLDRHDEAADALRRAVEVSGREPRYMLVLARHHLRGGEQQAAAAWLDSVLVRDPENRDALVLKDRIARD